MATLLELMRMSPTQQRDYLMNKRLDVGKSYARYGLESPVKVGDIVEQGMGALPGLDDAISAIDMLRAFENKEYGKAGLSLLGLLPFVGAIRDPAKSAVLPLSDWEKRGLQRGAFGNTPEGEAEHYLRNLAARQRKIQGTEKDPLYKLISEGVINQDNMEEVFPGLIFNERNADTFFPHGVAPNEQSMKGVSEAFRKQQGVSRTATGQPSVEDFYDSQMLSYANTKEGVEAEPGAYFSGPDTFEEYMSTPFMEKQGDLFPIFTDTPFAPLFDLASDSNALSFRDGLVHALRTGAVTPSSLKNNRVGIPDLFRFADDYLKNGEYERYKEGLSMADTQHVYDNGWMWDKLEHPTALEAEGAVMKHCVGDYCDKVKRGDANIYSLRDPEGKPHVTIELNPRTNSITQVHGRANSIPKKEYQPYIKHLTEELFPYKKPTLIPPEDQI